MSQKTQATGVADARQQHAAELSVLVARINSAPEDIAPVAEALERVLEIASFAPGGWNALIDCIVASTSRAEVLAFCRAFTSIVVVSETHEDDQPFNPVHDVEGVLA
jgi:hypothetical protein